MTELPYRRHLRSNDDLVTTYEATRTGFVQLALEKSRRATPFVAEARALQEAASKAARPADLFKISGIETGLLNAAGLSDKAIGHLDAADKKEALNRLIQDYLEPAGAKFVEELVFRFLLTRGDTLGGSMRNIGGALAQRKLSRWIVSTLKIAGVPYRWRHATSDRWLEMSDDDSDIEFSLNGLCWDRDGQRRTLAYNLTVPFVKNNVDLCLLSVGPDELNRTAFGNAASYIALGELKGGIDPAGADEHWKTARTALDRIRGSFSDQNHGPFTFFIGAAIEKRMATEIWRQLEEGSLSNAANLNEDRQIASLSSWLCRL